MKVYSLQTSQTLERVYPSRTGFRHLILSPDGTKLFYVTYRRGFPYVFGSMIKGEVWDLRSGKVTTVYSPGLVQGILACIATHKIAELDMIQWTPDSQAIVAPELVLRLRGMRTGQKYYRRPVSIGS